MSETELEERAASESATEHVEILTAEYMNGQNRLFGGRLMEWIDIVACVVARRHSRRNVTTAAVDNLQFREAAFINNTIFMTGRLTWTGRTSMEVCVRTYVESLEGSRKLINKAYVVMVAIDEAERPTIVPQLKLETQADAEEWNRAVKRSELRTLRRAERY